MVILQDFDLPQLTQYLTETFACQRFVGAQVYSWLVKGADFDQMTNVNKALREKLKENCIAQSAKIIHTATSKKDGTQKMLFRLADGNLVEGVLMKYNYGNTLCVSTQVGCRMGCKFCASTLDGLVRNLSAGEILGQVVAVNSLTTERNVTNVVLMGSGEPLDNYDNVVKFLRLLFDQNGLGFSQRNVSLSTCGLADKMKQFADEDLAVNMTLSLHSADPEKRAEIMPITKQWSIHQAVDALRYYFNKTKRRVIVEYTLIDGVNDSYGDALKLKQLLSGMSVHINLIRLNAVKERKLNATDTDTAKKFLSWLEKMGMSATLRRQMGADIDGACGQLRRRYINEKGATNE
ncbi:MAG: 23S rRNA (adenine(2503)-C(2))-methyltransferase RlmN [Clostridia bacterium]|nr:23S rRNA (adenine(2503)-C(2))-methyltransferase RlmN [Clostridia bacterium]